MSLTIYNEGDHPAGFIGIRIVRTVSGKSRQQYFSFRNPENRKIVSKKRQTELLREAQELEASWIAENAEYQYQKRISQSNPKTRKESSTGVEGLTLTFVSDHSRKKNYYYPAFRVKIPRSTVGERFFLFTEMTYSKAWESAVNLWAEVYSIRPKDRNILLAKMPPASQFVELRRVMNREGHNIPVECLHNIFAEQRQQIKLIKTKALNEQDLAGAMEREISEFMNKKSVISGR